MHRQFKFHLQNLIDVNTGFNYYRIKMMWKGELEDGSLEKIKTEDLVYASSYTEAENMAYAIIEDQNREKHEPIYSLEIIKTKIGDMLCNDTLDHDDRLVGNMVYNFFPTIENGEGFYGVKVLIITVDEKTAKEKNLSSGQLTYSNPNLNPLPNGKNSFRDTFRKHHLHRAVLPGISRFALRDIK